VGVLFGEVLLNIYRVEDPVLPNASVTDAAYREGLHADFDDNLGSNAHGEATSIAGHTAWTTISAHLWEPGPVVDYTCITYVIANQHLYRLHTFARGTAKKRPADFDAAVRAMSDITFEPVRRPTLADSGSSSQRLKMPRFKPGPHGPDLPNFTGPSGERGIVDVEFSIDRKGHARDIKQTYATSRALAKGVLAFLQAGVFRVPASWEANGSHNLRFTQEFQFSFAAPGQRCPDASEPHIPDADVVPICTSLVRY
jgi:hypothetical protein